ncbi:EamA family transporter [Pigmentiphaga aceris]|uniref:EamA family transporter n=2 Tax=Pigmentiphaga aceris TaxID=1940612 RepID=A0A5C0B5M7_9BURK|nr:EamA family transporter [Pigmentiphaga aceris]
MVSTRSLTSAAPPVTIAFLRYLIGVVMLGLPVLLAHRIRFAGKDAAAIAALGVLQFAVLIVLLNIALGSLSAATCALIFSTMPLVTLCLAVGLRQERFSMARLAGVSLAVAGVAVLLQATLKQDGSGSSDMTAMAALIGATLIGAICSMLYRPYVQRYAALPVSALAMLAAVLFLACLCVATGQPLAPSLNAVQWGHIGFIGLASGVGYFCWLWALSQLDASRVVAFQALGPITAAAIELLLTRAMPSWTQWLSMILVIAGLRLASVTRAKRTA